MYLSHHTIITITFYLLLIPKDNLYFFIPFFIGGVLVDLDHCLDYYLRYRKPIFSHRQLSDGLANKPNYIIPLHSYEFILFCIFVTFFTQNPYIIYFSSGYVMHMFLDIIFNHYNGIKSLSLIYRIKYWWNDVCLNMD